MPQKKKIRIVGHVIVVLGYLPSPLFVQNNCRQRFSADVSVVPSASTRPVLLCFLLYDCDHSVSQSDLTSGEVARLL